jgi:hypothetical protein
MEWKILTDKVIENIKIPNIHIAVYDKNNLDGDVPFDVIYYLDLSDPCLGLDANEIESHWASLAHYNSSIHNQNCKCKCTNEYEYTDDELLGNFTHYCIIDPRYNRIQQDITKPLVPRGF